MWSVCLETLFLIERHQRDIANPSLFIMPHSFDKLPPFWAIFGTIQNFLQATLGWVPNELTLNGFLIHKNSRLFQPHCLPGFWSSLEQFTGKSLTASCRIQFLSVQICWSLPFTGYAVETFISTSQMCWSYCALWIAAST